MAPTFIEKIADALHIGHHNDDANKDAAPAPANKADPAPAADAPPVPAPAVVPEGEAPHPDVTAVRGPALDHSKVTVIFVLGGPGAGKGTQCTRLVEEFGFCHLSAGDLLRAEQDREGSQFGELIRNCIREGSIVPMEVTIKLLEATMQDAIKSKTGPAWEEGRGRFLIDGFPRKMDQALKFEEDVCVSSLTIFFTTTEEVMLKRLLKRGETSGRADDNEESIKKRFRTYHEQTMPVIEYYTKLHKVASIDSSPPVDEVYAKSSEVVNKVFAGEVSGNVTA